jgi:hypothetical protein
MDFIVHPLLSIKSTDVRSAEQNQETELISLQKKRKSLLKLIQLGDI